MYDLTILVQFLLLSMLNSDMAFEFGDRISGLSHTNGILRVHFFNPFSPADEATAQSIIDAHDPVFITTERNGDDVTVTLSKPRNVDNATELTLVIDDETAPSASPLVNNVATVEVESADEITIGILENYPHQEATI